MESIKLLTRLSLMKLIQAYRLFLSPSISFGCRFYPSCSEYAETALKHAPLLVGIKLIMWRLLRCHPFAPGGYDPFPLLSKKD